MFYLVFVFSAALIIFIILTVCLSLMYFVYDFLYQIKWITENPVSARMPVFYSPSETRRELFREPFYDMSNQGKSIDT